MKNTILLLVALVSLVALSAVAADPMPAPDPMLRQLDYLGGNWSCRGTAFASPFGPEHATRGMVTTQWMLNNRWLSFRYAEEKSKSNATPFSVAGFMGYDPERKKLVIGGVDSMGGYSTEESIGWEGDRIVFEGPNHMGTMTATGRDTFMRMSKDEMMHTFEVMTNGSWQKAAQETCTRKKKS